jgi:hypothetical protein
MPCSSRHEAWPKLSPFGQQFKDNGYQMGNDRDAPILQQAAYWPVTFRITLMWHRESTDKAMVDGATPGTFTEAQITTHRFDLRGQDFHSIFMTGVDGTTTKEAAEIVNAKKVRKYVYRLRGSAIDL